MLYDVVTTSGYTMPKYVHYDRKRHTVIGHASFRGRQLPVLEYLTGNRQIMRVFDKRKHLPGTPRCLHLLPWSKRSQSRLQLLARVSRSDLPMPSVIDTDRQGDTLLVLSEWTHGRTVQQFLKDARKGREPWPSLPVIVNLGCGLVGVAKVLHERIGMVHGDINPNNVVITQDTRRLVPIDFGSTWYTERTRHRDKGDGVSRSYAAPEHWIPERHVTFLSDQFSVGALLYELMTGVVPYDGLGGRVNALPASQKVPTLLPTSLHLQHENFVPAKCLRSLDAVMNKCLALDPTDRFETSSAWLQAMRGLRDELHSEPHMSKANTYLLRIVERMFG